MYIALREGGYYLQEYCAACYDAGEYVVYLYSSSFCFCHWFLLSWLWVWLTTPTGHTAITLISVQVLMCGRPYALGTTRRLLR